MTTYTVVPTLADQRWGPEAWCLLDYYRNPNRVGVDAAHPDGQNPVIFWFNAGGNEVGSHRYGRDSSQTEYFFTHRWILDGQEDPNTDLAQNSEAYTTSPAEHFDICWVTTAQRKHTITVIDRSIAVYGMDMCYDAMRALALISVDHIKYGFDPDKKFVGGESNGAMKAGLGIMGIAPVVAGNEDSRVRGVFYVAGPVDLQSSVPDDPATGTDAFHYSILRSILGIRGDAGDAVGTSSNELIAFPANQRAAMSLKQYFADGNIAGYPKGKGFYVAFVDAGDHVKPYGDPGHGGSSPHDSQQVADLTAAMDLAGVDYEAEVLTTTALANTNYGIAGDPQTEALAQYQRFGSWFTYQLGL